MKRGVPHALIAAALLTSASANDKYGTGWPMGPAGSFVSASWDQRCCTVTGLYEGPATGVLQTGDEITAINGKEFSWERSVGRDPQAEILPPQWMFLARAIEESEGDPAREGRMDFFAMR